MEVNPEESFTLKLRPNKTGDRFYLKIYEPVRNPVSARPEFWVAGIPLKVFPKSIQTLFVFKDYVGLRSLARPEVEADTLKLKLLMESYAPLHNLTRDRALAKCALEVTGRAYYVNVPHRFRTESTFPWRIMLERIKVVKFPEEINVLEV